MSGYDVHPSVAMVRESIARLKDKTGRDLDEWVTLTQREGPPDQRGRVAWLKSAHGLGSNYATWLGAHASGDSSEDGRPETYLRQAEQWVEEMYAGPKQVLRPIHDALLELARSLGPDIKVSPCQTIVPIYRQHVIAQIRPSTRTRIDFGLALGDTAAAGRLLDTGGFAKKDRITHRIPITSVQEIDDGVRGWLKRAYDRDA